MTEPSQLRPSPQPAGAVDIRRAVRPSPELGHFLYTAVGGNWYWIDRLEWTYEQWQQRLSHPRVETWVMYLGVLPAFMGQRLGGWLLSEAIRRAWAMGARRVWVH